MSTVDTIYRASPSSGNFCLRQGEIISDIEELRLSVTTIGTGNETISPISHPNAIIISQDCDLEQDYNARHGDKAARKLIPCILFCEIFSASEIYDSDGMQKRLWDSVRQNKADRYHFLQKVDVRNDAMGSGLIELVVDFKRYFAIPTDEVYCKVDRKEAKRRCVLTSPYLEHFSSRFANYLSRIALPSDHASD